MWRGFLGILGVGLSVACGGSVRDGDLGEGGAPGSGGSNGVGGTGWWSGGTSSGGSGPWSGGSTFEEPPCPDLPPPEPQMECDPLQPYEDCDAGEGCYVGLSYSTDVCAHSQLVSVCYYAGIGEPGELCDSLDQCEPGLMCVVGPAGGARCATICAIDKAGGCPDGLICGATDVPGYGVCF